MFVAIFRSLVAVFGVILILIGIPLTPSPIPFGLLIIALGLALLIWAAPGAVRGVRRRWRWFDRQMDRLENVLPPYFARLIRRSDVDQDDDEDDEQEEDDADDAVVKRASEKAMRAEGRRRRNVG